MKRVIAAVVLLLIVTVGCTVSYTSASRLFKEMVSFAQEAEEHWKSGDIASAQRDAERLAAVFDARRKPLSLILPHEALTEAEKSIQGLTLLLTHGEPRDFVAEVRRCRLLLERLWDEEKPAWYNVL